MKQITTMRYWIALGVLVLALLLISASDVKAQVDKYNCNTYVPPTNDDCDDAILFSGTVDAVTCCGSIGQIDLCGDMETSIWFTYNQASEGTQFDFTNIDIDGPIGIEIYSGDCDNLTLLARSDCAGFTQESLIVPNCNRELLIHISTKEDGCGAFTMTATDISGCNAAEDCTDVTASHTMFPFSDQGDVSLSSCLDLSCNSSCTNQSVWFQVRTDGVATALNITIKNADFDPLVSIISGSSCNDGSDIIVCEPFVSGETVEIGVTQDFVYYIEVSSAGGDASSFDICVNTIQQNIDCANASLQVIRQEFPGANPQGPYCPGETVTFCYDLEFFVDDRGSGNNCQWLQGVVPVLGGGWDLAARGLDDNVPNDWVYWPEGTVDFNVDHPTIGATIDPLGRISLEYGLGGLSSGDLLPAGWWITTSGTDPDCVNDGDPDNMWGKELPCNSTYYFTHCFDLTTRAVSDIQDCADDFVRDLSVEVYVFADGQTGCYDNSTCTGDVPATFEGRLDCSTLLDIIAQDKEMCSGEFLDLPVYIDGGYESAISVEVVDAGNTSGAKDWIFESGNGILPDQITNTSGSIQTVSYAATLYNPLSDCPAPTVFFEVTVFPEVVVAVNAPLLCEGAPQQMSPNGTYDSYEWYDLDNNLLSQDATVTVSVAGIYILEVTEGNCEKQIEVDVTSVSSLPYALLQEDVTLCNADIGTLDTSVDLNDFLVSGITGNWLDASGFRTDSNIDVDGETEGTVTYQFTTDNAQAPCLDTTYNFSVIIEKCTCPTIDVTAVPSACAEGQVIDLSEYVTSSDAGTFAVTGGPDVTTVTVDADGMMTLSEGIIGGDYTFTFTLDGNNFGPSCTTSADLSMTIGESAAANILTEFTACNSTDGVEPVSLDLSDMFVDGAIGFWKSDDLSIDATDNIDFIGTMPGMYTATYETSSATTPCINQSYTLTITVNDCACEPLELSTIANICQGDEVIDLNDIIVDAAAGTWSISSSTATILPTLEDNSRLNIATTSEAAVYDLTYTLDNLTLPANCTKEATVSFEIIESSSADILPQATVCNLNIGTDPDSIDLDDLYVSGSTGEWGTAESALTIDGDNIVSFAGQDVRDYIFTYTTNDATAPCQDVSYDITISVKDCACPALVLVAPQQFCNEDLTIPLLDFIVDAEAGTWEVVAGLGSAVPEIVGDNLVITSLTEPGLYDLVYTLSDPNVPSSCATEAILSIEIFAAPTADVIDELVLCNMNLGTVSTMVDLDTLVVSGSEGDWTFDASVLTVDSDNIISFDGLDAAEYVLSYTTNTATPPCTEKVYTVAVILQDCSCPVIDVQDIGNLCQDDQVIDLTDFEGNSEPGIWSDLQHAGLAIPPVLDSIQNEIIIEDNTTAGDYTVTYTLSQQGLPPSCTQEMLVAFSVVPSAGAEVVEDIVVCNSAVGSLPLIVDLDTLVLSGDTGEWSVDNGLSLDADNIVNFDGIAVGSYTLTYTTNTAVLPCVDESYDVNVVVTDCSCPLVALGVAPDLCNSDIELDLSTLLLTGVGAGTWSYVDGPEILTIDGNNNLQYNGSASGLYTLEYTLEGTIPNGCDESATAEISIYETPELVITPEQTVCNAMSSQSPTCVDFTTFSNTSEGVWEKPAEYTGDFSDITNVCFEGLAAGTEYTFTFTTNNATLPCDDVSASITIEVINCDCPNLELNNPEPLCADGGVLELSTLETSETVSGMWSFLDGPETVALASDNIFDVTNRTVGIYTFEFTPVVTPDVLCDQSATIEVQVFTPLSAGTGNVIDFCEGEEASVLLSSLLDNADSGGNWEETSTVPSIGGIDPMTGTFSIAGEIAGTYEFTYSHLASATCPSVAAEVIVVIRQSPVADAGPDFELTCAENTVMLGGPNMDMGQRVEYMWTEEGGQVIPNAQTADPIVTQPGIYSVELLDNLFGCVSRDTVIITEDRSIPTFVATVRPVSCDGTSLGGIVISNSQGGNGDYSYSIDEGSTWTDNTLFDNLAAGTYDIIIEDGNGCQSSVMGLVVPEPIFIGLDIGEDQEVAFGDVSITLSLNTIASAEDILIVVWEEDGEVICEGMHNDCVEIEVDPDGVSTYCVTVTDDNGCQESACVVITEVLDPNVYMANIFTPDQSTFNNRIFVQTDENIELVSEFVLFDRWGEKVFQATPDHTPNNPAFGWDGQFNASDAPSGVYTYFVEVIDVLGDTRKISGTVTLMR